jgi:GDP-L-fucose synthase
LSGRRVYIAGHRGMVGNALVQRLKSENCTILTVNRSELDLTSQLDVQQWVKKNEPDLIFLAAAKVGGIQANASFPADFIYQNLVIQTNVIQASFMADVSKLVLFGSSCSYPKFAPQPVTENQLLEGALESTNIWYSVAKIAGIKMAEAYRLQYGCDFITLMPTNTYGPYDNYDPSDSHVIPALIRKFHLAKVSGSKYVEIWGSGKPFREFIHADDLADAAVFLAKEYSSSELINVGTGKEVNIADLARRIANVVGFEHELCFDSTKPDGSPRKLLNSSKLRELGWYPGIELDAGLQSAYNYFLNKEHSLI